MARNLDMTALRSFVTVAETGGVTRAADRLHLTQSAVSMQLKRLEKSLDVSLLDRSGRGVTLTEKGVQLHSYGKRILSLNDEVWSRMTDSGVMAEIRLGVPHDIVYPHIPEVLHRFNHDHPRVKVTLDSSYTMRLKAGFEAGELDVILTTETDCPVGAEALETAPLVWIGAPGGCIWRSRPLRLAFENACLFRGCTTDALDAAGVEWDMAVTTESSRTIEATVQADLAVHVGLERSIPPSLEAIDHHGELPSLPRFHTNLYVRKGRQAQHAAALAETIRATYQGRRAMAAE